MFELADVESTRLKEVVAPFSMDVMREFFMDKSKVFIVDYEQSQLKGKSLLIYLSNLDIPCEVHFSESVSLEEKFDMLKFYMESRNLFSLPSFTKTVAELLFMYKDLPYEKAYRATPFSHKELTQFLERETDLIGRYVQFCDNLGLFAITTSKAYREQFGDEIEEGVEVIDDPFYVGQNIVDLFFLPNFFEFYFSTPPQCPPVFFKRQFQEQMFRGKTLFQFFANPNNSMFGMLVGITEGMIEPKDFNQLLDANN